MQTAQVSPAAATILSEFVCARNRLFLLPPLGEIPETWDEVVDRRSKWEGAQQLPLVLVADDEVIIRNTLVEILRNEGYDAVGVEDGVEAVECARKIQPDIFLADVAMPRMNGIEAAKEICRLHPTTRVICFSGHGAASELVKTARKEGHDFELLLKPVRPEVVIDAVRRSAS